MPSLIILAFSPLIVLLAYIIFGLAGFGSTLISIPLLAHLYPLKFVLPVVVVLDCVGAFSMGFKLRENVNRRELLPLLPFMLAGMVAGVFLLVNLPGNILLACLSLIILLYGTLYAMKRDSGMRVACWAAAPLGLVAGISSALFGVGGPIYVMYLSGRGATPDQVRATVPVIFMFTTIGRITLYIAAGLFSWNVLLTAAALLPVMFLGLYAGHRLHLNLRRDTLIRIIGGVMIASGVSLLLRALET